MPKNNKEVKKAANLIMFRCGIHKHHKFYKEKLEGVGSILEHALAKQREEIEEIAGYTEHEWRCILSRCSAGRPTKDGGYENKFDGKWYQSRPVDKTPKCTCGLSELLDTLKK